MMIDQKTPFAHDSRQYCHLIHPFRPRVGMEEKIKKTKLDLHQDAGPFKVIRLIK